jgi:hypothetical protein
MPDDEVCNECSHYLDTHGETGCECCSCEVGRDPDEGCGYSYDHHTVEDERDGLIVWSCTECGAEGFEETQ